MRTLIFFILLCFNSFAITIDNGQTVDLTKKYNKNQGIITINSGGTLLLGGNNLISNQVGMVLNGGELMTQGYDDSIGTLTLSSNSTIDMGSGSSLISFAALNYIGGTITINNWSGSQSGGGSDRLVFSNTSGVTQTFLNNVYFSGYGFGGCLIGNELVAVPEAETYIAGLLIILLIAIKERRWILNRLTVG